MSLTPARAQTNLWNTENWVIRLVPLQFVNPRMIIEMFGGIIIDEAQYGSGYGQRGGYNQNYSQGSNNNRGYSQNQGNNQDRNNRDRNNGYNRY